MQKRWESLYCLQIPKMDTRHKRWRYATLTPLRINTASRENNEIVELMWGGQMGFSSWEDGHGRKLRAQKSKVMQWQTGESQALAPFHCDGLLFWLARTPLAVLAHGSDVSWHLISMFPLPFLRASSDPCNPPDQVSVTFQTKWD